MVSAGRSGAAQGYRNRAAQGRGRGLIVGVLGTVGHGGFALPDVPDVATLMWPAPATWDSSRAVRLSRMADTDKHANG